jgi:hypothetical protein
MKISVPKGSIFGLMSSFFGSDRGDRPQVRATRLRAASSDEEDALIGEEGAVVDYGATTSGGHEL